MTAQPLSAKTHSGLVTLEVDLSAQPSGQSARLWVPYPVSDRDQVIKDIRWTGDYAVSGVYTDRTFGTPILYAEWPKEANSRKLNLSFTVDRQVVAHRKLPKTEPKWNPADYAEYLKATSLGPVDGVVKRQADQIVKGKKTVLAKAKAIYD
jgi:hypothetical protein